MLGQVTARRFNRWLYWATIIASTTAGTTLADSCTRPVATGDLLAAIGVLVVALPQRAGRSH